MALKIVKSSPAKPSREQALQAAQSAYAAGDLEKTAASYLLALELNEQDSDLFMQLGVVLYQLERYDKAVIALRQALEINPMLIGAVNAMGVVMFKLQWYAAAEVFFRRVIALDPLHAVAKQSLLEAMRKVRETGDTVLPELAYLVKLTRPAKPTVSLCMIVKNEEQFLEGCLESVQGVVDEIVIVDTGSTDRTIEIAQRFGAKILHHDWNGDFALARNISLKNATSDWILVLDADERLDQETKPKFTEMLENREVSGFGLVIENRLSNEARDAAQMAIIFRLFRNRPDIYFEGIIHEQASISAEATGMPIRPCEVRIIHLGYMDVHMHERDKLRRNLDLLERQQGLEPENPYVYYNLGQTLKMMDRREESEEKYRKALEMLKAKGAKHTIPYYANLYFSLGDLYRQMKRYEDAHALLDEGIALYPSFPDLVYTKGFCFFEQERYPEAIAEFEKVQGFKGVIHVGGTDPTISGHKGLNIIGVCYAKLGDTRKAKRYLQQAIDLNPRAEAELHTNLGILHLQDQEFPEALAQFVKALEKDPRELRAWLNLASISYRMGQYQDAIEAWEKALSLDPELPDVTVLSAEAQLRVAHFDAAISLLNRELARHPDSRGARLNLGLAHFLKGEVAEAKRIWQDCQGSLEGDALLALAGLYAGETLTGAGREESDLVRIWIGVFEIALIGQQEARISELWELLMTVPTPWPSFEREFANLIARHGDAEAALQLLLKIQERSPQDALTYVALGDLCMKGGNREDALIMYTQANSLDPQNAHVRRQLTLLERR